MLLVYDSFKGKNRGGQGWAGSWVKKQAGCFFFMSEEASSWWFDGL